MTNNPVTQLPMIVAFDGMHDTGPADPRPNGTCPHCGAEGRYIYWFVLEDGSRHGAMAGCLKLFPQSETAKEHQRILDKQRQGKKLNGWDNDNLDAIEGLKVGRLSKDEAIRIIRQNHAKRDAWIRNKYRR